MEILGFVVEKFTVVSCAEAMSDEEIMGPPEDDSLLGCSAV
jgi:hypothetical protein